MKRADAAPLNDLRPAPAAATHVLVVFRGKRVVVDPHVLRLLPIARLLGLRHLYGRFQEAGPDNVLLRRQEVLQLGKKLVAHPADGRAQTVLVLSLGRAGR